MCWIWKLDAAVLQKCRGTGWKPEVNEPLPRFTDSRQHEIHYWSSKQSVFFQCKSTGEINVENVYKLQRKCKPGFIIGQPEILFRPNVRHNKRIGTAKEQELEKQCATTTSLWKDICEYSAEPKGGAAVYLQSNQLLSCHLTMAWLEQLDLLDSIILPGQSCEHLVTDPPFVVLRFLSGLWAVIYYTLIFCLLDGMTMHGLCMLLADMFFFSNKTEYFTV